MQYRVTFYQAAFHTIVVDANDPIEAEMVAKHYTGHFPGAARVSAREFVRWNIEQIEQQH